MENGLIFIPKLLDGFVVCFFEVGAVSSYSKREMARIHSRFVFFMYSKNKLSKELKHLCFNIWFSILTPTISFCTSVKFSFLFR